MINSWLLPLSPISLLELETSLANINRSPSCLDKRAFRALQFNSDNVKFLMEHKQTITDRLANARQQASRKTKSELELSILTKDSSSDGFASGENVKSSIVLCCGGNKDNKMQPLIKVQQES